MLKISGECAGMRRFSTLNKTVCILANSKSADIVGAKVMKELKEVSQHDDLNFIGYGGKWMKEEGLLDTVSFDIE